MKDHNPPSKPMPLGPAKPRVEPQKNYVKHAPDKTSRIITGPDGKVRTNIPENEGHKP